MRAPAAIGIMRDSDDGNLDGIALSPDDRTLVVRDFYNELLFFDARTYRPIGELDLESWVDAHAFSPDGTRLAVGTGREVRLIDASSRKVVASGGVDGRAAAVDLLEVVQDARGQRAVGRRDDQVAGAGVDDVLDR